MCRTAGRPYGSQNQSGSVPRNTVQQTCNDRSIPNPDSANLPPYLRYYVIKRTSRQIHRSFAFGACSVLLRVAQRRSFAEDEPAAKSSPCPVRQFERVRGIATRQRCTATRYALLLKGSDTYAIFHGALVNRSPTAVLLRSSLKNGDIQEHTPPHKANMSACQRESPVVHCTLAAAPSRKHAGP